PRGGVPEGAEVQVVGLGHPGAAGQLGRIRQVRRCGRAWFLPADLQTAVPAQVGVQARRSAADVGGTHGQVPCAGLGHVLSPGAVQAGAVQAGEGHPVAEVAQQPVGQRPGGRGPARWVHGAHSLIAPWLMPEMKLRWKIRYMITIGATVMIVAAASSGMLVVYCPTNRPSPAGAVRIAGSCMSTITSRNWFQVHMNTSTARVVKAEIGRAHVN